MYKLHLILKYLRKRRIAWVSLAAVMLCTTMVLVVISVMGGWLRMFLDTSQALEGDVIIDCRSVTGFGHYEEILDAVRKLPQVKAAIPVITTIGMANFGGEYQKGVQVTAYGDLDQVGLVNSFHHGLYRQYIAKLKAINDDPALSEAEKEKRKAELDATPPSFDKPLDPQVYRDYLPGENGFDASKLPGIICGSPTILAKQAGGQYDRGDFIYHTWVELTVGDLSTLGTSAPSLPTRKYWIVDDCRTGFYPVDTMTVYVPFDKLQSSLGMTARDYEEKVDGQTVQRTDPARVNQIQVALNDPGAPGLAAGTFAVEQAVNDIESKYQLLGEPDPLRVEPWDEHQAQYIGAVVHEKVLLTFLFGIISIVAVFLVFCIFYMIVVEKTRDIGIIKSVGASNGGVAAIFLGYGLSIGIIGAGLGLLWAYLIIHNINELHAWMGRVMHVTIWDPQTYIFDTIPSTMQTTDVTWIVSIAVLSALAGAMVPAVRAARMNPVDALRWE